MLGVYEKPEPEDAVELLDCEFPDEKVRTYAVGCVSRFSDAKLELYML